MPSLLIVDDNADIRGLVRSLLNEADGLEVTGEADNGQDALRLWADTQPDVVVLDQCMPGLSGMEVAEIILGQRPGQTIVIFTANAEAPELRTALTSGVRAVLTKERALSLVPTIRRLLQAGSGSRMARPGPTR